MQKTDILIIGSGAGGLGAAAWAKNLGISFLVVDGSQSIPLNLHNGVHYLHSIPNLPFESNLKEITLTDGILSDGEIIHQPNLLHSLKYSEKVREIQHPSSIMDVGKKQNVYMPPSNTLNELLQKMADYAGMESFKFGYWLKSIDEKNKIASFDNNGEVLDVQYGSIISTIPLDIMRPKIALYSLDNVVLESNPVYISNYRVSGIVPNWLINLYIPNQFTPIYRCSILNNVCSVESVKLLDDRELKQVPEMLNMFHISTDGVQNFTWKTGKVLSISKDDRYHVVSELMEKSIYQIGRFGLWNRKLLVDSTIQQAADCVKFISGNTLYMNPEEFKKKLI